MLQIDVSTLMVGRRFLTGDMQISVPVGETHLLEGPNGCGKSLLLDVVTGTRSASGVRVLVKDRLLRKGSAFSHWQAGIRRMFQSPAMPRDLTVLQILEPKDSTGSLFNELSIKSAQVLSDNDIRLDDLFGNHSFGQQRLVELIVALSSGQCCLLDEPFAGLKPSLWDPISELIKLSADSGNAILVVDHLSRGHSRMYDKVYAWKLPKEDPNSVPLLELETVFNNSRIDWLAKVTTEAHWSVGQFGIDDRMIMRDAEISLPPGTILLLVGGNGTGKSTLMRELGGYKQPWAGISARITRNISVENTLLSPQPPKLVDELTAEENLWLMIGRGYAVSTTIRAAAKDILTWLGFPSRYLRQRGEVLSGGEASMVALVGAALSESMFLFLDEPFEALSKKALFRAVELLRLVTGAGKSVLATTHSAPMIGLVETRHQIDLARGNILSGYWEGTQMKNFDCTVEGGAQ